MIIIIIIIIIMVMINDNNNNKYVKLDFANAFNSVRRDALLEAVARDIPELYRFMYATYEKCNPILKFGDFVISSAEGVQQGDPFGPLEFCLVINPLIRSLSSELCVGFRDDLTLGGLATTVAEDITNITDIGRQLGLELNASKCEIVCNIQRTVKKLKIFGGFKTVQLSDLTLLGSPVL